ncbi:MAG: glycosyltransferase [Steroidobacter sp.]
MKFIVVTYGTEGDTRPLAALCQALMTRGHDVRLLADRSTLGPAAALGVPTTPLAGDIRGTLEPGSSIANVVEQRGLGAMAKALAGIANASAEQWLRTIVDVGKGCDAVIISGLTAFVGLSAAEYLRVPAIGTGLIPLNPTREFPSPFLPPGMVPRWLNNTSHHFVNQLLWRAFRKATNRARANVCHLPARKSLWTTHPMLYGVSPGLLPKPSDWPANATVCGQWLLPSSSWLPPADLCDFLQRGDPPLYVGFGSMVGFDRKRMMRAVVAGVGGRRALFYPGWSGVETSDLPDNFFVIGETPHDWLFPKTSLAIHHGGSGTSHSACRAGVPSVVVPFAGDQFFWADRLRNAGVAARVANGKSLDAASLSQSIAIAESEPVRLRARTLGKQMRVENGLNNAIAAIEAIMAENSQPA